MRTLSIRQPWAWLILRPDLAGPARDAWLASRDRKDVENRDWATSYRGPLLIHASKTVAKATYAAERQALQDATGILVPELQAVDRGGIVGLVELVDCAGDSDSRWYTGAVAWVLANPQVLPFRPCKGALQLFHTPLADLGLQPPVS